MNSKEQSNKQIAEAILELDEFRIKYKELFVQMQNVIQERNEKVKQLECELERLRNAP